MRINEPSYSPHYIRVAVRNCIDGKKIYITKSAITNHYSSPYIYCENLDDATKQYDMWLTNQGYIFLSEERFEKLRLLV